jgi:hypothetical protein
MVDYQRVGYGIPRVGSLSKAMGHYLILPIPSMFLYGTVLMRVALFIPAGLLNSSWARWIPGLQIDFEVCFKLLIERKLNRGLFKKF